MGLDGHVDQLSRRRIVGWARDADAPDAPVGLVVSVDGRPVARCLAGRPRDDLVSAGIGHGRHGFDLTFPEGAVPALARCAVAVRREGDGAHLPGSPRILDPVTAFDADLQETLARALAEPVDDAEAERRLAFLLEQAQRLRQAHADRHGGADARAEAHGRVWGEPGLAPGGTPAVVPAERPRALVIDFALPAPARDAGSNAILSHVRALARLGYAVTFVPVTLSGDGAALEAEGVRCCLSPWYATVEEVLRRETGGYALVYLHRIDTAGRYLQLVRDTQPGARLVYNVADLHHLRVARQAQVEGRDDLSAYAEHLRVLEITAARAADAVITHSTFEAEVLRRYVVPERVHVVPWAVAPRLTAAPFGARRGMAFIGSYAYPPNLDAARWLLEAVMPALAARGAAIPCLLVGGDVPASLRALAASWPGVAVLGPVPDLSAVFDRVRLSVAPLAYGAGVKGKVLDSLAAGIPCACTPTAAEGIGLPEPLAGLVADTPEGLARSVAALHGDEGLNRACAEAGLAYVAERLSEGRVDALMRVAVGR